MADITVGPVIGHDCKAYYNSATAATPTWVEITQARDVAVPDFGNNAVAANSRASNNESFLPGLIKYGVTFTYLHTKGADTVRDVFTTMVTGRSTKQFAFMDGGIALVGARGVKMFAMMEKFSYSQGQEEAMSWDASLKPAYVIESAAKVEPTLLIVV